MPRVKSQVAAHARHKKILKLAKGFHGRRKNTIRAAHQAVDRAGQCAYRGRKERKRAFRSLWITRINAAARKEGTTYGILVHALHTRGIDLDRKMLALLAVEDPETFTRLVREVTPTERS